MTGQPETDPAHYRHIRSFGTRRGNITVRQRDAIERLEADNCLPFATSVMHPVDVFKNENPLVLEIGCGMGETTAQIALNNPDTNYLAVEVYPAGIGSVLLHIEQHGLTNLKVIQHDAIEVLQSMIQPASLAAIHVFFPDPWPKKRHHKRRLIQQEFVSLACSRLQNGGLIHCATDWQEYAEQMLEVLTSEPTLDNASEASDGYFPRPAFRPTTKFETRGIKLGHQVHDLVFKKPR